MRRGSRHVVVGKSKDVKEGATALPTTWLRKGAGKKKMMKDQLERDIKREVRSILPQCGRIFPR